MATSFSVGDLVVKAGAPKRVMKVVLTTYDPLRHMSDGEGLGKLRYVCEWEENHEIHFGSFVADALENYRSKHSN